MNKSEVSKKYQIPVSVLDQYESWGLCHVVKYVMGQWQYDKQDLKRLSTIMALHDIGFSNDEVEQYMRLLLETTDPQEKISQFLTEKRNKKLSEIHLQEKQLERIDFLRHRIEQTKE